MMMYGRSGGIVRVMVYGQSGGIVQMMVYGRSGGIIVKELKGGVEEVNCVGKMAMAGPVVVCSRVGFKV